MLIHLAMLLQFVFFSKLDQDIRKQKPPKKKGACQLHCTKENIAQRWKFWEIFGKHHHFHRIHLLFLSTIMVQWKMAEIWKLVTNYYWKGPPFFSAEPWWVPKGSCILKPWKPSGHLRSCYDLTILFPRPWWKVFSWNQWLFSRWVFLKTIF